MAANVIPGGRVPNIHLRTNRGGSQVIDRDGLGDAGRLLMSDGGLLWLDVQDPTLADIEALGRSFPLHHLALEDAYKRHQRPKIEDYPTFCFLVVYTLAVVPDPTSDSGIAIHTQEISVFLGANFLITVHVGPSPEIAQAVQRWDEVVSNIGEHPGALLYALLDTIVDDYFPAVDQIAEKLDEVEEQLFERFDQRLSKTLFALRRQLVTVRRFLGPERDILNSLLRREGELIPHGMGIYLQDVYDHILRVVDTVDTYRDMLAGDMDAYLSAVSNNLNRTMKALTAISAVLMTAALITGFYGMNVAYPGRDTYNGYLWSLGLIAVSSGSIIVVFRRLGWFS